MMKHTISITTKLKCIIVADSNSFHFCIGTDLTFADIMLTPWFFRIDAVFSPLRGFVLPRDNAILDRVQLWWNRIGKHRAI